MSIISLSSNIKQTIQTSISNIISTIGKECKIVYPPILVECTNCVGQSVYKHGGPMPFAFGVCPLCKVDNVKTQENFDIIKMTIDQNLKKYLQLLTDLNIRNPDGLIVSRGYIVDVPKIKQCEYMQVQNVDAYTHFRYKLEGEPIDPHNLAQGVFFLALWKRF